MARFSFDLSRRSPELDQALIQAIGGDLRLAGALANRQDSGVEQPLAVERQADSFSSYFGLDFLTLSFYRQKLDRQGTIVIATGELSQRVLFDELEKKTGFFFTRKGYKRRSLVALESQQGRVVDAQHNFQVVLNESDEYTERDQIQDLLDPLLAFFIDPDRLETELTPVMNDLEHYVSKQCPRYDIGVTEKSHKKCVATLHQDPQVVALGQKAQGAYAKIKGEGGIKEGMDPALNDTASFAHDLFYLKLAVQAAYQFPASMTGPKSNMVVDFRLSGNAITSLFDERGETQYNTTLAELKANVVRDLFD